METDNIRIKTFFIVIASVVSIEGAAFFISRDRNLNSMLFISIVRLLEIIAIMQIVITLEGGLSSIGLEPSTIIRGIKKGLLWSAFFGMLTGLVFLLLNFSGINPLKLIYTQLPADKNQLSLFLMVGCLIGPVAEELFFRGILYGFFRRWGIPAAIILTTIIFILAHRNSGTIPAPQAAGGIIFAMAYEIEKSLIAPIIIHILGNTAIFILSLAV